MGHAIARVERADYDFNLKVVVPPQASYDRVIVSTDTTSASVRRGAESLPNSAQSERVHFLEPENFSFVLGVVAG